MKIFKDPIFKFALRSVLISLFLIFMSIVIIIEQKTILFWVIKLLGIVLLVDSIIRFILFFKIDPEKRSFSFDIIRAVIEAIIAILALVITDSLEGLFYIFTGVLVIVEGILHLQFLLSKRRTFTHWLPNLLIALSCIILGVFIVSNPFAVSQSVNLFVGIELLAASILSFVAYIYFFVFLFSSKYKLELREGYDQSTEFVEIEEYTDK